MQNMMPTSLVAIQDKPEDKRNMKGSETLTDTSGRGGGVLNKFLYGKAPPQGPTPYPFIYHFLRKRYPFRTRSIDKWYFFHIPLLELCIPLNCCKCIVI